MSHIFKFETLNLVIINMIHSERQIKITGKDKNPFDFILQCTF